MSDKKNRRYDTVIFDLDGTLLDTLADLTNSTNAVMRQYGMPIYTKEEIRGFVGNGIRRLMKSAVPQDTDEQTFEAVYQSFCEYYELHCMDDTEPYPGILSLLDWLQKEGYQTAIVSNKADFAVKKLNQIYFKDYIAIAVGEREGVRKKPEPDSVLYAMQELGVIEDSLHVSADVKARTVYVGDSEVDLMTAKNAGLDCIAVCWGFRSREALMKYGAKETQIAADVNELKRLLEAAAACE